MAEWRLRELCYVQSVEYSVVHCSVVQSEPAVVMVVCGLWSVHLRPHHTRPEDQEDGREFTTRFISLSSFLPSLQPPSLPPLPSVIKYLLKIGKLQVNSSVQGVKTQNCNLGLGTF